jgi:hypothetical protein
MGIISVADALKIGDALEEYGKTPHPSQVRGARNPASNSTPCQPSFAKSTQDGWTASRVRNFSSAHDFSVSNPVHEIGADRQDRDSESMMLDIAEQDTVAALQDGGQGAGAGSGGNNSADSVEVEGGFLATIHKTIMNWTEHLKIMSVVLMLSFLYESSLWLSYGGFGTTLIWLAVLPHFFLNPVLMMGTIAIASSKDGTIETSEFPYKFCKPRALAAGVLGCIIGFFWLVPLPNLQYPEQSMAFGVTAWVWIMWFAWPAYLLYIFRKAFRWGREGILLAAMVGFLWGVLICGFVWWVFLAYTLGKLDMIAVSMDTTYNIIAIFLLIIWFRTSVYDSCVSYNSKTLIRGSGPYLLFLVFLVLWFPWLCAGILGRIIAFFGNSSIGKLAILFVWSIFLAIAYLNLRLVAVRCLPFTSIPVLVLPMQLVGDMFTELVFMDFDMASWEFWVVMLFDVALLILRDADLYEDVAMYVKKRAGPAGELVLHIGQLMVGYDLSSVGTKEKMAKWDTPPTEKEQVQVKRELTENW